MLIENRDNPHLKINSITTGQVKTDNRSIGKGNILFALLDNARATAPDYDLQNFRDRIPGNSVINIKKIIALSQPATIGAKKQAGKWWIWPVIILVLSILTILAWKLVTDMRNKNDDKTGSS